MIHSTWVVGPFQCNCRLFACPKTGEAVLVDPGDEAPRLIAELGKLQTASGAPIRIKYLLHTHAHLDHIGASREIKQERLARGDSARIALHREDEFIYKMLREQGRLFGFEYQDPLPVDHFLGDEEELRFGECRMTVTHTPGHSPGGVCFRLHEDSALGVKEQLLTGDTLFAGSIGRTDLWGGDTDLLLKSIKNRIFHLDDDLPVCPGHGPDSTVGHEKRNNPFFR